VGRNALPAAAAREIRLESVTEATDLAAMQAAGERLAAGL
jgi:hypothetical protein